MLTAEQFGELLKKNEGPTLDFKATAYDFSSDDSKIDLVKDVICMANTPRTEVSYLVLGVNKYSDGKYDLVGLAKHIDDADLQGQFNDRVHPVPALSYVPVHYEGNPPRQNSCRLDIILNLGAIRMRDGTVWRSI